MEFTLVKKIVVGKNDKGEEIKYSNLYLKNGDLFLPITIKKIIVDGDCVNQSDYKLAVKLAENLEK